MTADRISVGELQELLAAGRKVTVLDSGRPRMSIGRFPAPSMRMPTLISNPVGWDLWRS